MLLNKQLDLLFHFYLRLSPHYEFFNSYHIMRKSISITSQNVLCVFCHSLDFESVLKIEPGNKLALSELEKLDKVGACYVSDLLTFRI